MIGARGGANLRGDGLRLVRFNAGGFEAARGGGGVEGTGGHRDVSCGHSAPSLAMAPVPAVTAAVMDTISVTV